jgi:hypothetical protein
MYLIRSVLKRSGNPDSSGLRFYLRFWNNSNNALT